ncbi:MAG: hypothetical protein OZ927_07250 [Alcaligenaceae bacterium]|nr:hypothetical protein [Alcaligenaceae bacterium]
MNKILTAAACCLPMLLAPASWAQDAGTSGKGPGAGAYPNAGTQAGPRDGSRDRPSPYHPGRSGARPERDACVGPGAQNNPRCADSQRRSNPGGRSTPPGSPDFDSGRTPGPRAAPDAGQPSRPGQVRERRQPS